MSRTRLNSELAVNVAVLGAFLILGTSHALAEEPASPSKPVEAKKPGIRNYGLDEFGEPFKHLQPLKPRTSADEKKIDSVAWYMTGQLRLRRKDLSGALKAYQMSIDLNPGEQRLYQAFVPLAFQLSQIDLGVKYALQAAQIDPDQNYQWMRQLSAQLFALRRFPQAVEFLEKARESKSLKKNSVDNVLVNRDLGLMYGILGRKEKAADAFEVVFDALLNREKYNLSARRRRVLERDRLTNYEQIGNVFLEVKRIELAVKAFEEAEKAGQGQRGSLGYNLAQVYHQTKQDEKALTQLEKYFEAQLQSKGRDAYQLLADIFKGLEKSDALIGRLEELAEKDPHNSVLQFYLAEQYLQNDRLDDAEKTFKKGISSGNSEGYAGLAAVYRRQNRPADLLEAMANAVKGARNSGQLQGNLIRLQKEMTEIAKDSKLLEALLTLGRDAAGAQKPTLEFPTSLILAKLSAMGENNDAAIEFYHYAVDLADKRVGLVYIEFGRFLIAIKRYAEAVTLFQQAVDDSTVQQSKAQYLYHLSRAQSKKGDTQAAFKSLAEARKLLADRGMTQVPEFDFQEALIYFDSKQWDQAIEAFKKYISAYPQDREMVRICRSILSSIYVEKGEMKKGEEILEQMFAEDPEDPTVNNDLGYLYADQGKKLEQAEKMIRKAVKAQPENAAYLDSLGWVLFKLNRVEEAVPPLEKAASKKPEGQDATIFDHLGDCYDRLNRSEKAIESWKKALEFARKAAKPNPKMIQKIEDKLKKKTDE
ncbi:MAG: tetratricopeptide repeat protein [Planctomycetes bacterium]|nr:tetratricopeptide repeat protein [Planctomycetota bacterium]